ncbi:MAG: glycosyltransferase family protein, partial [Balneolaceae bacterium]
GVPCIALSHQASFLSPNTPRPDQKSYMAEAVLQHFAPAQQSIGFHFRRYDKFIEPPVIRSAVRELTIDRENHITVYLPAYHHRVLKGIFCEFPRVDWHIFSPSCNRAVQEKNLWIHPVSNKPFLDSFASCRGVICNAGFEMCAESMYLGKRLLAVPIRNQYEQQCNAIALERLGILTLPDIKDNDRKIRDWLDNREVVGLDEIADPEKIVRRVIEIGSSHKQSSQESTLLRTV